MSNRQPKAKQAYAPMFIPAVEITLENRLSRLKADISLRDQNTGAHGINEKNDNGEKEKFPPMTVNGMVYAKRDKAGGALIALTKVYHDVAPIKIGSYRGFDMALDFNPIHATHHLTLKGNGEYGITMSESASGCITKINNVLNGLEERILKTEEDLRDCANQARLAQIELKKPFGQEAELTEKSARLAQLNLELNINNHSGSDDEDDITLSEDEEYSYRTELESAGLDETELFADRDDDSEQIAAAVGRELAEQGQRDELIREMESEVSPAVEVDFAEERKTIIAEARRKLAGDGAMPVITDAMEGRAYSGEIVEMGTAYAIQKVDEGRGIIHNLQYLKDFTRVVNESGVPYLEISYDRDMNGSVGVKEAAGRANAVGMGR